MTPVGWHLSSSEPVTYVPVTFDLCAVGGGFLTNRYRRGVMIVKRNIYQILTSLRLLPAVSFLPEAAFQSTQVTPTSL